MVLAGGKRKFPRKEIELGILFKHGMEWYPATIRDLSVQGISFNTSMAVKPGDWCHIYFNECKEIFASQLKAMVVRFDVIEACSPAKNLVAVELIDASDQYVRDVQAIFQIEDQGSN